MKTDAPQISGTYPLAGEKIGPAWRAIWSQLSPDTWTDGPSLAEGVAAAQGLDVKTTANLLASARRAGLLEVAYRTHPVRKRRAAFYRVKEPVAITTGP